MVGYSRLGGNVVFLFGDVKTPEISAKRPPPLVRRLRIQLEDLGCRAVQAHLIMWLKFKRRQGGTGADDPSMYRNAIRSYMRDGKLLLAGVLVTEAAPDKADLRGICDDLAAGRGSGGGAQTDVFALYVPVSTNDLPGYMQGASPQ